MSMGWNEPESAEQSGTTTGDTSSPDGASLRSSPRDDRGQVEAASPSGSGSQTVSDPREAVPRPASEGAGQVARPSDPTTAVPEGQMGSFRPAGALSWSTLPTIAPSESPSEMPPVSQQRFEPGQVVFDRYVVREKLGEGGMGSVWLVRHLTLDVDRALKIIVAGLAADPQIRGRFKREAQVMAQFSHHTNAVTVHDAQLTDDAAFIEMEFVQGRSLDKLLTKGVPFPLDRTARILAQLCDVLQVAHQHRIVHRDLKPSNLMLVDGLPPDQLHLKVLDFGIAKILEVEEGDGAGDVKTMPGTFIGTAPYTSPEQAEGLPDERSDIYSVGVILYELLTGFRPFSGNRIRMISDTLNRPPPPFAHVNPHAEVPPEVERLVLRCLEKDPPGRPQTPRELAAEFLRAISPPAEVEVTSPTPVAPHRRLLTRRGAVVALLLGGLGLIGGLELLAYLRQRPPGVIPTDYEAEMDAEISDEGLPRIIQHKTWGTRFILIEGTSDFRMGGGEAGTVSPASFKTVPVPGFYLQECEVTNGEMARFFDSSRGMAQWQTACHQAQDLHGAAADRCPAVFIDHATATEYAKLMGGDLPTEAQWEYAARSGGQADRPFIWKVGPAPRRGETRANLDRIGAPALGTLPVGSMPEDRTDQGVRDLAGNVREWCQDPGPDGGADGTTPTYAVRGGSWSSRAALGTATGRDVLVGSETLPDLGFRIAIPVRTAPATGTGR
jgi:formylglycine-generating enzyme required for sulfatase activity/tRNA A-37 threonylcarbamoyl transferase component Bud32